MNLFQRFLRFSPVEHFGARRYNRTLGSPKHEFNPEAFAELMAILSKADDSRTERKY
jgi:hypothetical protein